MPLVTRNGNRYYHRTKRVNGRVISVYCGANEIADQLAQEDRERAAERAAAQAKQRAELAEYDAVAALVDEQIKHTRMLIKATYLANGYHQHKGQWRKTRTKKDPRVKPAAPSINENLVSVKSPSQR